MPSVYTVSIPPKKHPENKRRTAHHLGMDETKQPWGKHRAPRPYDLNLISSALRTNKFIEATERAGVVDRFRPVGDHEADSCDSSDSWFLLGPSPSSQKKNFDCGRAQRSRAGISAISVVKNPRRSHAGVQVRSITSIAHFDPSWGSSGTATADVRGRSAIAMAEPSAAPNSVSLGKCAPTSIRCNIASAARIANHQRPLG